MFYMFRLLSEIADVLGDRKEVTADDLDKLKYTEQVIQEVLRMYPPVPNIIKESPKEGITLSCYHIPEGTPMTIEAKVVLTRLLQTFKVTLPPSYKLVVEQLGTNQPKGDVPCTLQEVFAG
eukprot:Em0020g398a